jgi:predicted ATPase with chaperone activity
MLGSPGAGKSMLVRRLTTILPAMTLEAIDTTRIHGGARLTDGRTPLMARLSSRSSFARTVPSPSSTRVSPRWHHHTRCPGGHQESTAPPADAG